jgi:Asp-tRNA(Asn)/Glu-tRNA(Gln) amidotransferase A subunit family amidase
MHNSLPASKAAQLIREGALSSVDLVRDCLARINETDSQIGAWAHVDAERAMGQAAKLDDIRKRGYPLGKLHGVPIGLKDIIDTKDAPTECGTDIFAGRQPDADAALVERLVDAGAIVIGKTVTTELAFMHPSKTRNPHNVAHTPGGSSSGSAAAVAAYHVPIAVGTQTNGSVIRPASYCGTYGFKPSRGMISRRGVLRTSKSLDQVGAFARSAEDVSLVADALSAYDPKDNLSFARPRADCHGGYWQDVPVEPDLVWLDMPYDNRLANDAREGLAEVVERLNGRVERIPAPNTFANLVEAQRVIHQFEFCQHLQETLDAHRDALSEELKTIVKTGRGISADMYAEAISYMEAAEAFFDTFFHDYDAIIAPSAGGEAPKIEDGTGDPIFSTIWTLCGLPCLTMPLLVGEKDLPIGVQLIGARERDDRLLRTARWVESTLTDDRPTT